MIPPTQARARNAAATRQAILASARRHFARDSYDAIGLREIARDAGVDPALISRYFGGKEQLFREALRGGDQDIMRGVTRETLPAHFAALLMDEGQETAETDAKVDQLLMLLRSASSPKASEIVRAAIDEDILKPVAAVLQGPDGEMRASLGLAVLMGSAVLRSALCVEPLCAPDREAMRPHLTRLFAAALAIDQPPVIPA
jgi:AcrR family transcriptional regulator